MSRQIHELIPVVIESLESSSFVFADFVDGGSVINENLDYWRLEYHGDAIGTIAMSVSVPLAQSMAINMLGIELEMLTEEMYHDALGEILNIVAGQILTEWYGDIPVFNLSIPESISSRELSVDFDHLVFNIEGHGLEVFLSLGE